MVRWVVFWMLFSAILSITKSIRGATYLLYMCNFVGNKMVQSIPAIIYAPKIQTEVLTRPLRLSVFTDIVGLCPKIMLDGKMSCFLSDGSFFRMLLGGRHDPKALGWEHRLDN